MLRSLLIRVIALTTLPLGLVGFAGTPMGQTTWEAKHLVVDDAVIDAGDPFEVIDPVWWIAKIYEGVEIYESTLSEFSKPQRLIFAVIWYRSEVNNGGHDQFFHNSTGIVWPDALEALHTVGLDQFAEILGQAVERFSRPPSQDRDVRIDQMEADEPEFDDLDKRFYDFENAIDVDAKLMAFIRKHRSQFYFDGTVKIPK